MDKVSKIFIKYFFFTLIINSGLPLYKCRHKNVKTEALPGPDAPDERAIEKTGTCTAEALRL